MAVSVAKDKRVSWEFGRFVRTGNFYNAFIPNPLRRILYPQEKAEIIFPNTELWSNKKNYGIRWGPLDDVVMGGASKSDIKPGELFTGVWNGFVTTANNGGFAGIRTQLFSRPKDMSSCRGFVLRVRGDGNRYKFIIRDDDSWNGIAWSFSYDTTPGKSSEIKIPISSFVPTRFAKSVDGTLNSNNLCAFQMTHSKFEYDGKLNPKFKEGPFSLEIEYIGTY